jgi:exodeoxyribonuclease VII large subunit
MTPQIITVSEFLGIINETLGFAYPKVIIEGEVSSFKVNQGKFVFFDLKDESGTLSCFMMLHQLKLPLEDGMKIRATGSPKITKYSKFSLTVRDIELAGEGELRRAMELLKRKLQTEGLFDESRKRPLPRFPGRIGLITSGASAAYSDFVKILGARWGGVEVLLADISVQGVRAPDQIVEAIDYFNVLADPPDVIVLIRGGGSLEDLIAFSTEPVARSVAASRAPIVVGVGHEIDFSLADFAADVRAATPTDAARLVVPDRSEISARVESLSGRIDNGLYRLVNTRQGQIDRSINIFETYLRYPRERVTEREVTLWRGLDRLSNRLSVTTQETTRLSHRLGGFERLVIAKTKNDLANLQRLLRGFDPTAILNRGYAIVRHDEQILRSSSGVTPGDSLMIQLAQGQIDTEVRGKTDDNQAI